MSSKKVLMTGVTSFTGAYIARALVDRGFQVTGVLTRPLNSYTDPLMKKRLEHSRVSAFCENAPVGSENFLAHISQNSYRLYVSHGAAIQGYRSPDFDFAKSVSDSLKSIRETYKTLAQGGLKGVIHSGTVFEPVDNLPAVSPYGLAKKMVWEAHSFFAQIEKVSITKVWITNPIGPLENEDRLLPIFAKTWKNAQTPKLTLPRVVYDHIPAEWLAQAYVKAAETSLVATGPCENHLRPSGFVLSNEELVERFKTSFEAQIDKKLSYEIAEVPNFKLAPLRKNLEPCAELSNAEAVNNFWNSYGAYFKGV